MPLLALDELDEPPERLCDPLPALVAEPPAVLPDARLFSWARAVAALFGAALGDVLGAAVGAAVAGAVGAAVGVGVAGALAVGVADGVDGVGIGVVEAVLPAGTVTGPPRSRSSFIGPMSAPMAATRATSTAATVMRRIQGRRIGVMTPLWGPGVGRV